MNCKRKILSFRAILILGLSVFVAGCGVKGDPLPPEKPTPLGRGRPTYKRATEGIKLQKRQTNTETGQDYSDEEQE